MTVLSQTSTLLNRLSSHPCRALPANWCRHARHSTGATSNATFESIGVDRSIVHALNRAFPHVRHPTTAQTEFIPAILSGKDIILQDHTGSGKTFGLLLALLSQPRQYKWIGRELESRKVPVISSLLITPHRDLAYQCLHWISSLQDAIPQSHDLASIVQVLVRGATSPLEQQISSLHENRPQIVIGTPQAVLEVLQKDSSALQPRNLSTVIVDEVDYLVEYPAKNADKYALLKFKRQLMKHPSPTRQILDLIRARGSSRSAEEDDERQVKRWKKPESHWCQFVMTSATIRPYLRKYLMVDSDWLSHKNNGVVIVEGDGRVPSSVVHSETKRIALKSAIAHYAIVVSNSGEIKNIEGAAEASPVSDGSDVPELTESTELEEKALTTGVFNEPDMGTEEFEDIPSPFNLNALEAIGEAFALDVARVALLVLPASASVKRAVFDLRTIGVNAHGLDVLQEQKGGAYLLRQGTGVAEDNPTLLVSTFASTRGLDLPDLTHVFILGVPEDRSADTYLHIAGRVGRFGREGKVISVLEERQTIPLEKGKKGIKDEPDWLAKIFKKLRITPRKLEHFE